MNRTPPVPVAEICEAPLSPAAAEAEDPWGRSSCQSARQSPMSQLEARISGGVQSRRVCRVLLGGFAALVVLASTAPSAGAALVVRAACLTEVVVACDDGSRTRVVAIRSICARVSPDG